MDSMDEMDSMDDMDEMDDMDTNPNPVTDLRLLLSSLLIKKRVFSVFSAQVSKQRSSNH